MVMTIEKCTLIQRESAFEQAHVILKPLHVSQGVVFKNWISLIHVERKFTIQ